MTVPTFHMSVETAEGVKPHGFHLGTVRSTAWQFVMGRLRQPDVRSVALYCGDACDGIYDFRDLPEYPEIMA